MNFVLLLAIFAGLAYRITAPADRKRYLGLALGFAQDLKIVVTERRPAYESFRDVLRARMRDLYVTPALATASAALFACALFGPGAMSDPDTLVGWGASVGTRTTNGEWWRLLTAIFVHTGLLHFLVNLLVLLQLGAVLERLAGRLAFAAVFLSAGLFTGLINISSHPVEATVSGSGAIFGLYGLLVAVLAWQMVGRRPADPTPDALDATPPSARIPLTAIKRLAAGGVMFLLYSAVHGTATAAEFTGLFVGLGFGLAVAWRASEQAPDTRVVGGAVGAAIVLVVAWAMPLRNIADVAPEIIRVVATEERTATKYQAAFEGFKKGRITAEALAQLAERTILPELQAVDARLTRLRNVPREHQGVVADAREYLRLRVSSWRARAEVLRRTSPDRGAGERSADASGRLQAEAKFRSDLLAMGNAEGAERASLQAFQRVKPIAPPPAAAAAPAASR